MIEPIRNGILSVEGAADNVEEEMLNIERENCMSMGMNDKDSCSTVGCSYCQLTIFPHYFYGTVMNIMNNHL